MWGLVQEQSIARMPVPHAAASFLATCLASLAPSKMSRASQMITSHRFRRSTMPSTWKGYCRVT
jgi:hypothetical protein